MNITNIALRKILGKNWRKDEYIVQNYMILKKTILDLLLDMMQFLVSLSITVILDISDVLLNEEFEFSSSSTRYQYD